jgi:hypothetical protein
VSSFDGERRDLFYEKHAATLLDRHGDDTLDMQKIEQDSRIILSREFITALKFLWKFKVNDVISSKKKKVNDLIPTLQLTEPSKAHVPL